jgi:hypothetical protein
MSTCEEGMGRMDVAARISRLKDVWSGMIVVQRDNVNSKQEQVGGWWLRDMASVENIYIDR